MRVICTTTEIYVTGSNPGGVSIRRGSIYNVINVLPAEEVARLYAGSRPAAGDWYELLELTGYHHSCNFLELPEDDFLTDNKTKELCKLHSSKKNAWTAQSSTTPESTVDTSQIR